MNQHTESSAPTHDRGTVREAIPANELDRATAALIAAGFEFDVVEEVTDHHLIAA